MKTTSTIRITLTITAALVVFGCKKPESKDAPAAEGSTDNVNSDRSKQVMNYYVDFFNTVIRDAPAPLKQYLRRADKDKGLSVATMTKWANVVCGPSWMKMKRDKAKKKLESAKKASSGEFAKLPPLGEGMLTAGIALNEKRDAMCKYVKGGGFKKDDGAKAAEFHKEILATRKIWFEAVGALASELDRIEDAQVLAEIKKHEAAKGQSYYYRYASFRSNQFLRVARREPAKLAEAIGEAKAAIAETQAFAKAQGDKLHKSFAGYMKQVDRMAVALDKLEKGLARAKTDADKVDLVDKQFGNLVSIYNTMVSLYNTLIGAESRGELS